MQADGQTDFQQIDCQLTGLSDFAPRFQSTRFQPTNFDRFAFSRFAFSRFVLSDFRHTSQERSLKARHPPVDLVVATHFTTASLNLRGKV